MLHGKLNETKSKLTSNALMLSSTFSISCFKDSFASSKSPPVAKPFATTFPFLSTLKLPLPNLMLGSDKLIIIPVPASSS